MFLIYRCARLYIGTISVGSKLKAQGWGSLTSKKKKIQLFRQYLKILIRPEVGITTIHCKNFKIVKKCATSLSNHFFPNQNTY